VSSDGGAVWTQIDSMWYNDGGCLIGHPDSANVIISGGQVTSGNFGVSVSRDSGRNWTRYMCSSGGADFCYALAVAPSEGRTVYAGGQVSGSGAVYRSTDLGSTWARTSGSPSDTVFSLAVSPDDAGIVIAATPAGLFRTTDAGTNWTLTNAHRGFRSVRFLDGYDAAAGGDSGAVFSTDGGADWYDISTGPEGVRLSCLDFLDQPENSMIVGTHGASCWLWDPGMGVAETMKDEGGRMNAGPTVVRGVLVLGAAGSRQNTGHRAELLDITGRKSLDLHAGANDVSGLAPGVYFFREQGPGVQGFQGSSVKVVVAR
jgi:photosystem II stability/assembly factor-like uncharacterized protein